ncbi:hypothetical protein BQ8482_290032 [Mesorhizobium delmotii]|uniref:Uncharacterized protein n=1 Tax=Mesorhizobium delmotii TaxID=1631247 RepID=A0A2P9AMR0_9HYPH|nr:hypothetical protein BQ8482_290032 [Mesorhizobium delmotii]
MPALRRKYLNALSSIFQENRAPLLIKSSYGTIAVDGFHLVGRFAVCRNSSRTRRS